MARRRRHDIDTKEGFAEAIMDVCRRFEMTIVAWDGSPLEIVDIDDEDDLDHIREGLALTSE